MHVATGREDELRPQNGTHKNAEFGIGGRNVLLETVSKKGRLSKKGPGEKETRDDAHAWVEQNNLLKKNRQGEKKKESLVRKLPGVQIQQQKIFCHCNHSKSGEKNRLPGEKRCRMKRSTADTKKDRESTS